MSDFDPDESFPGHNLSDFTEEDFAQMEAAIASASRTEDKSTSPSVLVQSKEQSTQPDTSVSEEVVPNNSAITSAEVSFQSDAFDLNLRTLTAEDFERLDNKVSGNSKDADGGPSTRIEIEDIPDPVISLESTVNERMDNGTHIFKLSPLEQFRSWTSLSVTDLVSPAWCEVQYDYGLRGRRSRPISKRPKSFTSSSGKTISPEVSAVEKNDVRTKQGLAVHKQLEREVKFDELQVDISTEETRWALRLVNMLACLQGVLDGFTREMPVFGILHGEVVVGIMDEVCKAEATAFSENVSKTKSPKRPADSGRSKAAAKRARTDSPSQTRMDSYFESPKKSAGKTVAAEYTPSADRDTGYILSIKDHKTRNRPFLPSEPDMYPSRLQLMVYRRLLSELVARDPPYDFTALWETIGIDSKLIFPTKFLVQAQLAQIAAGLPSTCLDDLVASWRRLLEKANILGVDTTLELIYHLRPPDDVKGKRKVMASHRPQMTCDEEADLAKAIALSLESSNGWMHEAESSNLMIGKNETTRTNEGGSARSADVLFETEDMQLQRALQQSVLPLSKSKFPENFNPNHEVSEDDGIRRFKNIGSKTFLHDDQVLDDHLNHVMKWWRGEREPEGVPIDRTYRCSTCEYANDCEWRAQKALEFSKKHSITSRSDVTF